MRLRYPTAESKRLTRTVMIKRQQHIIWLTLVAAFALSACAKAPTEILVTVNSDFSVPTGLDRIVVQSYDTSGASVSLQTFPLRASMSAAVNGEYTLPISFAVVPQDGDVSRHAILDVRGYQGTTSAALVDRQAIMGFESGKKLNLAIFLAQACVGVTCSSDETCGENGQCVPVEVDATSADGGVDASLADAASSVDAHANDAAQGDGAVGIPTYPLAPTHVMAAPASELEFASGGVAVSADGNTLAACSNNAQAIDIFDRDAGVFPAMPTQRISNAGALICFIGIALSENGNTLIVGGPGGESVEVYERNEGSFGDSSTQSIPVTSHAVEALAIANDTIVVTSTEYGVVTYVRDGAHFSPTPGQSFSKPTSASQYYFGHGTGLSADGKTLVVSDFSNLSPATGDPSFAGAVDVFVGLPGRLNTLAQWTIPPPIGIGEQSPTWLGSVIALRADGHEFAITGQAITNDNPSGNCVFIYARDAGAFTLRQVIPAYATNLSFMADGTLVVGNTHNANEVDIYAP